MKAPATTGKLFATFTDSAGRRRGARPFKTRASGVRSNCEKAAARAFDQRGPAGGQVAFLRAGEACQRQADVRPGQATGAGPPGVSRIPVPLAPAAGRSRRPDNRVAEESSPRRTMSRSLAARAPHRVDEGIGKGLDDPGVVL